MNVIYYNPQNIRVSELMEIFVNPSKSHQGLLRGWSRRDLLAKAGDGREHRENTERTSKTKSLRVKRRGSKI